MDYIISGISLLFSLVVGIYNIRLNKKIYGPKIRVVFEKVFEHDKFGNFIEGRYSKYNILLTNKSIYNIYDFTFNYEFYNKDGKTDYSLLYIMGISKESISCFVPGQKYSSYFADFTKLKNDGIRKIRFTFRYKVKRKDKKYQEETFDINVIPLSDNSVLRTRNN